MCVQVCDLWIDVEGAPDAHAVGAELRDCGPSLQVPPDMYLLMYCVTKVGACSRGFHACCVRACCVCVTGGRTARGVGGEVLGAG